MTPSVLIVDDDREVLTTLGEGLAPYEDVFTVVTAEDGQAALEELRTGAVALVVTDYKMPRIDGLALLRHVMKRYPDIPVIVITAFGTPEIENLAREGGAAGYLPKPFSPESLARKIITTLRRQSDGGVLHGVSSGIFLQLIEMEQKTCTVRIEGNRTGQKGVLFFRDGEVLDARTNGLQGKPAAQRIFTWDKVTLAIQNDCPPIENKIQSELQPLILEAARLKDEEDPTDAAAVAVDASSGGREAADGAAFDALTEIRRTLEARVGRAEGVQEIYQDSSWDGLIGRLAVLGDLFRTGPMKFCFVGRGEASDHIIIPGDQTTVISVSSKSPPDKIMKALTL